MSTKDYRAIAAILLFHLPEVGQRHTTVIAHDLADLFAKDNPRFDRDKFLRAAGV